MGKLRDASKQETRDALIAAATLEFADKGIETASLDAICARAGFTRGAFYVHFKDREDLLVAVVDRFLTAVFDQVIAGDLEKTIAQYVARIVARAPEVGGRGKWRFHHTLEACMRSPVLRARYTALQREAMERVKKAARAGQSAGVVRGDVPAGAIAEILVILTLGLSAMVELEIPFDLAGGARALRTLLRPPRRSR
jgi:TetR/AcrR family transcriptional regulator, transcriptional repressor for nem operon